MNGMRLHLISQTATTAGNLCHAVLGDDRYTLCGKPCTKWCRWGAGVGTMANVNCKRCRKMMAKSGEL
jgi:hypothetical protein